MSHGFFENWIEYVRKTWFSSHYCSYKYNKNQDLVQISLLPIWTAKMMISCYNSLSMKYSVLGNELSYSLHDFLKIISTTENFSRIIKNWFKLCILCCIKNLNQTIMYIEMHFMKEINYRVIFKLFKYNSTKHFFSWFDYQFDNRGLRQRKCASPIYANNWCSWHICDRTLLVS